MGKPKKPPPPKKLTQQQLREQWERDRKAIANIDLHRKDQA
jgi:hypothetical protein